MFVSAVPSSSAAIQPGNDSRSGRLKVLILAALCVLPLLVVFAILWKEETGLPLGDDYNALIVYAVNQAHLSAGGKLLGIVIAQHNEYKLIFQNAIATADIGLTGRLHLLHLIWVGNLLLLPLGFIYWLQFRPNDPIERRLLWFLPLCWLLFQLTYAEMLDWANEGLIGPAVVCFAALSLYLLTRTSRRSFVLACIGGALAAFSSVNGFLLVAVGIAILLKQRRLARLIPWCVTFAAALGTYLYRYSPLAHEAPPSPFMRLVFVPSFLGGLIENMHGLPIHHGAIVLGLAMLLAYAHALKSGYDKDQPFIVAMATWAILSAMMTAWGRSSHGLNYSLFSRYKIYSTIMIAFCYQYLTDRVNASPALSRRSRKVIYGVTLAVAVLYALAADAVGMKLLRTRRAEAIAGLGWYLSAPQTHSPFPEHLVGSSAANDSTGAAIEARTSMTEALATSVYTLPQKEVAEACANAACAPATGR
jgi:hypothetical protein